MFDLIKRLNQQKKYDSKGDVLTIKSSKSGATLKLKNDMLNQLKQIKDKIKQMEATVDKVILEDAQSQQPQVETVVDDRGKRGDISIIQQGKQLARNVQVARKKYSMVRKRINQLTDEELSQ